MHFIFFSGFKFPHDVVYQKLLEWIDFFHGIVQKLKRRAFLRQVVMMTFHFKKLQ